MDSFNVMVVEVNSEPGLEFVKELVSLPYPPEHIFATYSKEENLKVRLYFSNVKIFS